MPYLIAALLAFSFAAGFGTAYRFYSTKAELLQLSIDTGNTLAGQELKSLQVALRSSQEKALALNTQLEDAHESDIQTINYYAGQLAAVQLPKPAGHQGCADALPKTKHPPVIAEDATHRTDVPEKLAGFLQAETYRADQAALDKNMLLKFVLANCGVSN